MRVMIIAGEASGDLHGAGVVRELKRLAPDCEIFGVGGDKMQSAGMQLIYHVRELSIMGFWEVIQHLPLIRSVEKTLEALLRARTPDVLLLIDYPGFNLRFARIARRYRTTIVYYISPQVWAWNPGRVKKMNGVIDKMLTVFPFEVDIYKKEGIDVEFVGHPLLEELGEQQSRDEFCKRWTLDHNKKIVGLFPGSRKQELERIFPAMIGAARLLYRRYGSETVVGIASTLDPGYVRSFLRDDFPLTLIQNATHDAMKNSDLAIVTSGTATLETAYLRTPMIVVYKTSLVTYMIGRLLVKIKNIGLVNIVAGKTIVPEILQSNVTPQKLAEAASAILDSDEARTTMSSNLAEVKNNLGTAGASLRVAKTVLSMA